MDQTLSPSTQRSPSMGIKIATAIGVMLLISAGIWGYHTYTLKKATLGTTTLPSELLTDQLYNNQETFRQAWQIMGKDDYAQAIEVFKTVPTSNNDEYSLVQYQIAHLEFSLDREKGIEALFTLFKDPKTNDLTKSLIMNILATKLGSTLDMTLLPKIQSGAKEINTTTLATPWLNDLLGTNNRREALVALFELSSSYYPIADSESMLAFLYAKNAADAKLQNNNANVEKYSSLAKTKIESVNKNLLQTQVQADIKWMYPYVIMHKGMALQYLQVAGTQGEDPAPYFQQALSLANIQGDPVAPFIRYNYATYLSQKFGKEQKDTIISLLKPVVENKGATSTERFYEYAGNLVKNKEPEQVTIINALSSLYPAFGAAIKK